MINEYRHPAVFKSDLATIPSNKSAHYVAYPAAHYMAYPAAH